MTEGDFNYLGAYFCGNADSELRSINLQQCLCPGPINKPDTEACPSDCAVAGSANCDIIKVPDPSWEGALNFALPVQGWIEPYISAWIVHMKQTGSIAGFYEDEFLLRNPPVCPSNSPAGQGAQDTTSGEAAPLGLDAMAGTYFFSGIIMIMGLLIYVVENYLAKRQLAEQVMLTPQDGKDEWVTEVEEKGSATAVTRTVSAGGSCVQDLSAEISEMRREMARILEMMEAEKSQVSAKPDIVGNDRIERSVPLNQVRPLMAESSEAHENKTLETPHSAASNLLGVLGFFNQQS